MLIQIDPSLRSRIPGMIFGCVMINGIRVREHDAQLWTEIEQCCQRITDEYMLDELVAEGCISSVRGMQKAFGFDPTRYRASSEALVRRVLKGLGIYQINTAVDVNNWCSLDFLLPICVYDLQAVKGQIHLRYGAAGEQYQGIGRQVFQVEGKIIVADDEGVIGNTVSDSERTKVTSATRDILLMIYAPDCHVQTIQQSTALAAQRMVTFNGGQADEAIVLTV